MAKVIRLPSAYVIDTKVVGVSKNNDDGTSRQSIIHAAVQENDRVHLHREPENKFDPEAVKVLTQEGGQIGYLAREVAGRVTSALINGVDVRTTVSWVSGDQMRGVGLRIELVN